MSKAGRVIYVTSGLRVKVRRVQRAGASQLAFTDNIGHPVGNCVKGQVHEGMGIGEIHDAVRGCAAQVSGKTYSTSGYTAKKRMRGRAVQAREYYEVS